MLSSDATNAQLERARAWRRRGRASEAKSSGERESGSEPCSRRSLKVWRWVVRTARRTCTVCSPTVIAVASRCLARARRSTQLRHDVQLDLREATSALVRLARASMPSSRRPLHNLQHERSTCRRESCASCAETAGRPPSSSTALEATYVRARARGWVGVGVSVGAALVNAARGYHCGEHQRAQLRGAPVSARRQREQLCHACLGRGEGERMRG